MPRLGPQNLEQNPALQAEAGASPQVDPEALATTLRATGATFAEAMTEITRLDVDLSSIPCLVSWAAAELRERAQVESTFLKDFLHMLFEQTDSAFAHAAFTACVGMRVEFGLDLMKFPALSLLPEDLFVCNGSLDLDGTALKSLPKGLRVDGFLSLTDCEKWDGVILADAVIKGKIYTDAFPRGVTQEEYLSKNFWARHKADMGRQTAALERHMQAQHGQGSGHNA